MVEAFIHIHAQGDNRMNINGAEVFGIATSRRHKPIPRLQKLVCIHDIIHTKEVDIRRPNKQPQSERHTTDGITMSKEREYVSKKMGMMKTSDYVNGKIAMILKRKRGS